MITLKKISGSVSLLLLSTFALNAQNLKEAIKLTEGEKYPKAAAAFQSLIKADPLNAQNYFYSANNYFKWGKADSAKAVYQRGIAAAPKSAINYAGLGQVQWATKDTANGSANLNKALLMSKSKDILVINKVGDAYINYDFKKIKEAQALLVKAEKKNYKNTDLHILKGDAYLANNQNGEAFSSYETAYDIDSTSFTVLLKLGSVMASAANYEKALDYLVAINVMDSTFVPAYKEKAYLCEKMENYELAIEQLRKYLSYNENLEARTDLARNLFLNREYTNAVQEINTIQTTDTSNIYLYRLAGYSLFETASYDSSAIFMQKFFEKAPNDKSIELKTSDYRYYGKALAKTSQDSLALIYLHKALEKDSTIIDLNTDIANSYYRLKNYQAAAKYHEIKIVKRGDKADAKDYNSLATAYYYKKEYVKADSIFTKVIELKPELFSGHLWRAKSNEMLDPDCKSGIAVPFYETVLEKANPEKNKKDMINARLYIGFHYIQNKNFKKAKEQYTEILKLDPNSPQANRFMSTKEAKAVK